MKITKVEVSDNYFVPFGIQIEVQTMEEAKALYAIFNYTPNTDLLNDGVGMYIRKLIQYNAIQNGNRETFEVDRGEEIANGIMYEDFYQNKTVRDSEKP